MIVCSIVFGNITAAFICFMPFGIIRCCKHDLIFGLIFAIVIQIYCLLCRYFLRLWYYDAADTHDKCKHQYDCFFPSCQHCGTGSVLSSSFSHNFDSPLSFIFDSFTYDVDKRIGNFYNIPIKTAG